MSIRSGLLPSQTINDFREIQIILEHEYSNSIVKNHSCPRVIDSVNLRMLVEKLKNEEISYGKAIELIQKEVIENYKKDNTLLKKIKRLKFLLAFFFKI